MQKPAPSTSASASTARDGRAGITPGLLVVLALLSAIAPIGTDLYLPAFTQMTGDLDASATEVQLSLTAFLLGVAGGQLVFGPLSDRFGRFRPLLIGSVICVVASAAAALAPTIGVLVVARLVQGMAGAAGMVIGRAMVSDLASGRAAARAFSLMMIVGGVAPVLAPFIGSLLTDVVRWRGILWVVTGLAVVMLVAVVVVVRETHTGRRPLDRSAGVGKRALLSRTYLGNLLAFGFGFSVMMAYISASPFVYQVMVGMTPLQYGLSFGVNAVGLVGMSAISARLTSRFAPRRLLGTGLTLVLAATVVLLTLVLTGAPAALLPIPIFVAVASLGLVMGNATAGALSAVPHIAGLGSAVLGALQFGLAALVSPLVSLGGEASALPLAIVMCSSAVIAVTAFLVAGPRRGSLTAISRE
ncbi:multidrug effflux MFS transporter [Herbiconiux sp. CPCC 203407]|uniref:Multidrug effflux MFS transporter n=1 Tax=Herbiconiux oxytropis TaxID=2970915 RepID=A0AA42BUF7_9MICO|nr:multidrug effflux MFS transporter [Herbiconiux oxytropis]MCS5723564.1 multidrug effflux MFS transporter [Herbiconiux oxytropis]MCS5727490.1 multidrug effflux MFS transporter [Herbiconiux oxytropis]